MAATYILGPFRLDAETDTLFRSGEPVSLGRRAVALLRVLVEQRGIPVSKDALMEAAWAGLTVEESNLAVQIGALRRVFGDPKRTGSVFIFDAPWLPFILFVYFRLLAVVDASDQGSCTSNF